MALNTHFKYQGVWMDAYPTGKSWGECSTVLKIPLIARPHPKLPKRAPKNCKKDCLCCGCCSRTDHHLSGWPIIVVIVFEGLTSIFQDGLFVLLCIVVVLLEFTEAGKTCCDSCEEATAVCSLLVYLLLVLIYKVSSLLPKICLWANWGEGAIVVYTFFDRMNAPLDGNAFIDSRLFDCNRLAEEWIKR